MAEVKGGGSLGISNALGEGLCREAPKHHRVHRPDPGTCQHGNCAAQTTISTEHQQATGAPLQIILSATANSVHGVVSWVLLGSSQTMGMYMATESPFPMPTDFSQLAYKAEAPQ